MKPPRKIPSAKVGIILLFALLSNSCATSVGMTAAAVTSATIAVGSAVVKAPFKLVDLATGDDDEDEKSSEN